MPKSLAPSCDNFGLQRLKGHVCTSSTIGTRNLDVCHWCKLLKDFLKPFYLDFGILWVYKEH